MRLKSFLISVLALFVIANVIVAGMRRCGLAPDGAGEGVALDAAASDAGAPAVGGPVGVEGLAMQLSRPLMMDVGHLGGLAAGEHWLYVATREGVSGTVVVRKIDPGSYDAAQTCTLDEEGAIAVGGIDAGAAILWVPVIVIDGGPRTVIVGLDAETLAVVQRFRVDGDVVALAEGPDGRVYGVSTDGTRWSVWRPDGTLSREATGAGGVRYADLDVARGSLLAAGSDGATGVIDVIDPGGLSLLARYRVQGEAEQDADARAWVTSGGLAVRGEALLLLPQGGSRPALYTYVPRSGGLAAFAPSVTDLAAPPTAAP